MLTQRYTVVTDHEKTSDLGSAYACLKFSLFDTSTMLYLRSAAVSACPAGKYADPAAASCIDCSKGFWCAGEVYSSSSPPSQVPCPGNMTTIGKRTTSLRGCGAYTRPLQQLHLKQLHRMERFHHRQLHWQAECDVGGAGLCLYA